MIPLTHVLNAEQITCVLFAQKIREKECSQIFNILSCFGKRKRKKKIKVMYLEFYHSEDKPCCLYQQGEKWEDV